MAKKILITEDSPTVLAIIQDMLQARGYSVITACDGQEALDKAKKEKPDLIILDLMLPKVDGYKVCAMLKFDKNFRNIPVIILTARAGESDKKMGEEVCANAYLTKPVDPDALISKVKELIKE
jgi:DNA-binding response OmpR family regulator